MKPSTLISTIAFTFIMLLTLNVSAQKFAKMDKSPLDIAAYPAGYKNPDKLIKVTYSRPQLKGRDLAELAPYGKVWRTGANEAANITLYTNMIIGGKPVSAGEYSLFTIPGEKEWTIIINKDINVWGAYSYKEANDVIRINAPVSTNNDVLEAFSIAFTDDNMHLGWDKIRIAVPCTK